MASVLIEEPITEEPTQKKVQSRPTKTYNKKLDIEVDSLVFVLAEVITIMSLTRPLILRPAWQVPPDELLLVAEPLSKLLQLLPGIIRQKIAIGVPIIALFAGVSLIQSGIKERENELLRGYQSAPQRATAQAEANNSKSGQYQSKGMAGQGGADASGNTTVSRDQASADGVRPVTPDPGIINIARKEGLI